MLKTILSIVALVATALQMLLMSAIGYPFARRSAAAMEAFRRSGFLWWIVALVLIVIAGLFIHPPWFAIMAPSTHVVDLLPMAIAFLSGLFMLLLVELGLDRLTLGKPSSEKAIRETKRYEGSLPAGASRGVRLYLLLSVLAVLEETVFRAIGLGGLWHTMGVDKFFAAGICSIAFGLNHWYFGWRQIAIKTIDGSILAWVALSAGWLIAALTHVLLNIILTAISQYRNRKA